MNYVADFETFVPSDEILDRLDRKKYPNNYLKPHEVETYVWGYGITEVGNTMDKDIIIGNNIDSFMEYCFSLKNPNIYFHNLKFDGIFILEWALKKGYTYSQDKKPMTYNAIISKMNLFYKIELIIKKEKKSYKRVTFYDSLKKLPMSVERIGKGFKLEHNKMKVEEDFYKKYRSRNHTLTEIEKEYLRDDIRVISTALQIQFSQGLTKMTMGSDALNGYKTIIGETTFKNLFPILSEEMDSQIRLAYRGGVTYASEKYVGKIIKNGLVYDVNSLYPYVMFSKYLPYGKPIFFNGKYKEDKLYNLHIQELSCQFKLKENHIPTIQIKNDKKYKPNEYIKESIGVTTLHLTNVDLDLFFEHYEVWDIDYTCGLKFRSRNDMFTTYIAKWTAVKVANTGAIRELAKLMLNSLYGKFGTNTDVSGRYAILDENGIVKMVDDEPKSREPVYTAIAVWTTSYGRELTLRTAQENFDRFAYCDTDSVHLVGLEEPKISIHPTELGKWKQEGQFTWAKFIGAKCYVEEIDGKLQVTVAGMVDEQKKMVTKENFEVGLKLSGKKAPKIVRGGIVLVDTDYSLKIRNFRT